MTALEIGTIATEAAHDWDTETPVSRYTSRDVLAGSVAWDVLTHSAFNADEIGAFLAMKVPAAVNQDRDAFSFLFDIVLTAGQVGYTVAQIDLAGMDQRQDRSDSLKTADLARAVAALLKIPVVEDAPAAQPKEVPA